MLTKSDLCKLAKQNLHAQTINDHYNSYHREMNILIIESVKQNKVM